MNIMNEYSDEETSEVGSTEDVTWGKPTAQEILRYFQREISPLSSRRQTYPPNLSICSEESSRLFISLSSRNSEASGKEKMFQPKHSEQALIILSSDDEESAFENSATSDHLNSIEGEENPITVSSEDEEDRDEPRSHESLFEAMLIPKITISTVESNNEYEFYKSDEKLENVDSSLDDFNKNTFLSCTSSRTQYFSANEENAPKSIASTDDSMKTDRSNCSIESDDDPLIYQDENNKENISLDDTMEDIENMLNNHLQVISDEEISHEQSKSETRSEKSVSRIPTLTSSVLKNNTRKDGDFKVPSRCCKTFKKTPIKKNSPLKFQDTVSPIRMYIKNSSSPFLKQTHKPSMTPKKQFLLEGISETMNIHIRKHKRIWESLPEVVYKPSRVILTNSESKIILPENIKKLVKERVVIKHEVRKPLESLEDEVFISDELRRNDLSHIISDEKNMSLHSAKQGFNL